MVSPWRKRATSGHEPRQVRALESQRDSVARSVPGVPKVCQRWDTWDTEQGGPKPKRRVQDGALKPKRRVQDGALKLPETRRRRREGSTPRLVVTGRRRVVERPRSTVAAQPTFRRMSCEGDQSRAAGPRLAFVSSIRLLSGPVFSTLYQRLGPSRERRPKCAWHDQ